MGFVTLLVLGGNSGVKCLSVDWNILKEWILFFVLKRGLLLNILNCQFHIR